MNTALTLGLALALDAVVGEPRRAHPLVAFGRVAAALEARWSGPTTVTPQGQRLRGAFAVLLLAALPVGGVWALSAAPAVGSVAGVVMLYLALGGRSLAEHAASARRALAAGDLTSARVEVGRLVSREVTQLTATEVAGAAVESVLENGNDAVFGALFWFLVAGAPGAVAYRLVNTLDAMWGYRTPRYQYFGWAAARLDDCLNLVPARLTAGTYTLVGDLGGALRCWRVQGRLWESPNAGPVMAAGAGALQVRLGGPARYHGGLRQRPALGCGRLPGPDDIARAVALVRRGAVLWLLVIVFGAGVTSYA